MASMQNRSVKHHETEHLRTAENASPRRVSDARLIMQQQIYSPPASVRLRGALTGMAFDQRIYIKSNVYQVYLGEPVGVHMRWEILSASMPYSNGSPSAEYHSCVISVVRLTLSQGVRAQF